jgi:PLP dependent protein
VKLCLPVVYSLFVTVSASIAENVARVRERMAAAARRSDRGLDEITLMAVSKTVPPEPIHQAYDAGLRVFGESRVQEFAAKAGELAVLEDAQWHMIGHLQSNKAGKAVELFAAVDSVDSVHLAGRLNACAGERGGKFPILIEINAASEAAKSGVAAGSQELQAILAAAPRWENLTIRGLMSVPPFTENPEESRPYFRRLRQLRDQIAARSLPAVHLDILSLGMSHDFEVAIEEGSTCVRVGTAIFGQRAGRI